MEWSEVVINEIPLFEFVNNGWNKMKHDKIHSIKFHSNLYFLFHQFGVYVME